MSNTHAIAAVTSCLQQIIEGAFATPVNVTTKTLDKAHTDTGSRRINLFLYAVGPNAAWRNRDLPTERAGERGRPPLALNLQYLLTVYADNEVESHKLLGTAVGALSDHAVLLPSDLSAAPDVTSVPNALFERVHVTLQPMTIEELSKLWSAFQSQYRLSVAYEASAALIESHLATPGALPVLQLGADGRGPVAGATVSRYPVIDSVTPATPRASEVVTIVARNLRGRKTADLEVVLSRQGEELRRIAAVTAVARAEVGFELAPDCDAFSFKVPADAPALESGAYGVSVCLTTDDELGSRRTYTSSEVLLAIAPRIVRISPARIRVGTTPDIKVVCEPKPGPQQRVRLLVGGREYKPAPSPAGDLAFSVDGLAAGDHIVRLRVDGVDSLRVVRQNNVLEFEKPTMLSVTP